MGTKNIHVQAKTITLGDKEYSLDYNLASFGYLSEKYDDISKVFSMMNAADGGFSREKIEAIANMIYAGVMQCDDDDLEAGKSFKESDKSGLSPYKIMKLIKIADISSITDTISMAVDGAMPDADPTKAEKTPQ